MIAPKIRETNLWFSSLSPIIRVSKIVVHHTGNDTDDDLSAEEIHRIHQSLEWSGCGYHYIVRKNGDIERGRPEWSIGSHAYGYNWETLGVHLSGNFELVEPTEVQIENAAYLIGWLCEKYDLVPDKLHVVGHRDLMATACPGENLYSKLQTLRGKSIWYQQNYRGGD